MESPDEKPDTLLRLADLPATKPTRFDLIPSESALKELQHTLSLDGLRKVRFSGVLAPKGKKDWQLTADLGATVIQPCVISLAPVTTRIDEQVSRLYQADMPDMPDDAELEMPEDDRIEPLPETIDLVAVLKEALSLALPLYPRAKDAALDQATFTEPGKTPLEDEDTRPFAGLAKLREAMEDKKDGKE